MIYPEQVGIRIAEGRRRQGLTQNRVAARMGVTPQAVSKWERGLSCPDLVLLDELAELLDTSIDRLLTGRTGAGVSSARRKFSCLPEQERQKRNSFPANSASRRNSGGWRRFM